MARKYAVFIMPILVACFILFEILLTQWRQRETYIQRLSQIDPLTNVLNRRSLNTHLEALHEQQFDYAVILLDIDHFKKLMIYTDITKVIRF